MTFLLKWAIAALVLLPVFLYFRSRPRYGQLFGIEFLEELRTHLARAKAAALEPGADPRRDPMSAGNGFVTSLGFLFLYTVTPRDGEFEHHVSMSYRGGPFARGAAAFLAAAVRGLFGVGDARCQLGEAGSGVYHFVFWLDGAAQQAFIARTLPPVAGEAGHRLLYETHRDREELVRGIRKMPIEAKVPRRALG